MSSKPPRNIFFIHQNIPAQFRYLAPALAADGHNVYFITAADRDIAGITRVQYRIEPNDYAPDAAIFAYAKKAGRAVVHLKEKLGVQPDLIIGHVSWGELMFLRDVYPDVPIIGYFEWFHRLSSSDLGFVEGVADPNGPFVLRIKNIPNYLTGDICTVGITPTWWQHSTFPLWMQNKIQVIFDGTDTLKVRRPPIAALKLPNGKILTSSDQVVTYISRGLEPIRGFPTAIRAIAELSRLRPKCHFIIVGRDKVAYGNPLPEGESYKDRLLKEVQFDAERVHFLGNVSYEVFLNTLYISSAHIYLTAPFILSWSMLEAMAAECLLFASKTPPVEEVVIDGHNGILVDFEDHMALAEKIVDSLDHPDRYTDLRKEARRTIMEKYDLHGICLPRQKNLIHSLI